MTPRRTCLVLAPRAQPAGARSEGVEAHGVGHDRRQVAGRRPRAARRRSWCRRPRGQGPGRRGGVRLGRRPRHAVVTEPHPRDGRARLRVDPRQGQRHGAVGHHRPAVRDGDGADGSGGVGPGDVERRSRRCARSTWPFGAPQTARCPAGRCRRRPTGPPCRWGGGAGSGKESDAPRLVGRYRPDTQCRVRHELGRLVVEHEVDRRLRHGRPDVAEHRRALALGTDEHQVQRALGVHRQSQDVHVDVGHGPDVAADHQRRRVGPGGATDHEPPPMTRPETPAVSSTAYSFHIPGPAPRRRPTVRSSRWAAARATGRCRPCRSWSVGRSRPRRHRSRAARRPPRRPGSP